MCPLVQSRSEDSFAELAGEASRTQTSQSASNPDLRGRMYRSKRLMAEEEAREFLRSHKVAHVGTVDVQGWPYVVPLVYVYEGGDILYLHSGDHQGHFLTSIQRNPRICVEVGEMGPVHHGRPYACNSALVYSSVIVFGSVRIVDDLNKKSWFFDRLLEKYGEPGWTFEPGYPHIHRIILYEQKMEIVTGKRSLGLYH